MPATATPAPLPFLGKWKWKSTASTAPSSFPMPQQGTTVLTQEAEGIHYTAVGTYSDGQTRHIESTFRLDGHSYPVLGGTLGDALSARPSDAGSLEVTVTRGGVLSARVKVTVSAAGERMTMHSEVLLPPHANVTWTTVSERQEDDETARRRIERKG